MNLQQETTGDMFTKTYPGRGLKILGHFIRMPWLPMMQPLKLQDSWDLHWKQNQRKECHIEMSCKHVALVNVSFVWRLLLCIYTQVLFKGLS